MSNATRIPTNIAILERKRNIRLTKRLDNFSEPNKRTNTETISAINGPLEPPKRERIKPHTERNKKNLFPLKIDKHKKSKQVTEPNEDIFIGLTSYKLLLDVITENKTVLTSEIITRREIRQAKARK